MTKDEKKIVELKNHLNVASEMIRTLCDEAGIGMNATVANINIGNHAGRITIQAALLMWKELVSE